MMLSWNEQFLRHRCHQSTWVAGRSWLDCQGPHTISAHPCDWDQLSAALPTPHFCDRCHLSPSRWGSDPGPRGDGQMQCESAWNTQLYSQYIYCQYTYRFFHFCFFWAAVARNREDVRRSSQIPRGWAHIYLAHLPLLSNFPSRGGLLRWCHLSDLPLSHSWSLVANWDSMSYFGGGQK